MLPSLVTETMEKSHLNGQNIRMGKAGVELLSKDLGSLEAMNGKKL